MDEDELAYSLSSPTPSGKSPLQVPPPNDHFVYTVGRAATFWPMINGNGATWLEEDIAPLYQNETDTNLTWKGKLVNLDHQVGPDTRKIIVGSTIDEAYIKGVGIDIMNQLDRRQLEAYDVKPDEFAGDGDYAKQSVEINCDRSKSKFIVMVKPQSSKLSDQKIFSADEAAALGIRRTIVTDPAGEYLHEGIYRVVEAGFPRRVRGVGMLRNPADKSGVVYDIAANQAYSDTSDLEMAYQSCTPSSLSSEQEIPLDNAAFAVSQRNTDTEFASEGTMKTREYPLYETNQDMASSSPKAGLIKAAVDALGSSNPGRSRYTPSVHTEAIKRVRHAHNQLLQGENMAITAEEKAGIADPLNTEIAALRVTITANADEKANALTKANLILDGKDVEIAGLTGKLAKADEEIANLKNKVAEVASAELANKRLIDLANIEGFEIKDEERAALVELLKTESDDRFEIRVLTEKNASTERKYAKKTTDEQAGIKTAEEHAGMKAVLKPAADGTETKNAYSLLVK